MLYCSMVNCDIVDPTKDTPPGRQIFDGVFLFSYSYRVKVPGNFVKFPFYELQVLNLPYDAWIWHQPCDYPLHQCDIKAEKFETGRQNVPKISVPWMISTSNLPVILNRTNCSTVL